MECLLVIGVFAAVPLIRKLFDKVPFVVLLLGLFVLYGGNMAYIAMDPTRYTISVLAAVAFAVCAFGFWLLGLGRDKLHPLPLLHRLLLHGACGGLPPGHAVTGRVCHPAVLAAGICQAAAVFSKKGLGATIALAAPFVVFGSFLMWYNAARFGSVLEFGHKFILTTNDMSIRTFIPNHVGRAAFYYFLQPPSISAGFPFLQPTVYSPGMQYNNFVEPMFGGILASQPLLWCLPLWFL